MADAASNPDAAQNVSGLRSLGKYHIQKKLGAGGMGTVFLASDTELKRTVALKVLPRDRAENPTLVRRFRSEAQASAQLRHPNIVAIYEAGEINGFPYIALECVEGTDVHTLIEKRGVLPPKRSLHIIRQVAEALRHIQEKGIVHRDIKPSNLLIESDGKVMLADLGLALTLGETLDAGITRDGTTVGTVDYISPEQACDSRAADIRSDLYSLGCTWYHMLTGFPPYPGDMKSKLHGHLNVPPPNPRDENPNVPEAYVAVIHRMMAKRPEDRYQTPGELLADLDLVEKASSGLSEVALQALTEEDDLAGSGETAADDGPAKGTSVTEKERPSRGKAAARVAPPAEEPHVSQKLPDRVLDKSKPRASEQRRRGRSRQAVAPEERRSGEQTRQSRRLPPRALGKNPTGLAINLEYGRFFIVILVVAVIVGGSWYALVRNGGTAGGGGPTVAEALAQRQAKDDPVQPIEDPAVPPETANNEDASEPRLLVLDRGDLRIDRTGPPFPGTDDLPGAESAAGRRFVPDWVYALRSLPTEPLQSVSVGTGATGGPTGIAEAIQRLRGAHREIRLAESRIYPLDRFVIENAEQVRIVGEPGTEPILLVEENPEPRAPALVQMRGGVLHVEGVHLHVRSGSQSAQTLFGVTRGVLVLKNCSVTIEEGAGPITLANVSSPDAEAAARVLFEQCLIRGSDVRVVRVAGPKADVVIGGSLVATQTGPVVDMELHEAVVSESASDPEPSTGLRTRDSESASGPPTGLSYVRLLGSTVIAGGEGLRVATRNETPASRLELQLRRTILATSPGADSTMLTLANWPAGPRTDGVRMPHLNWFAEKSVLSGWDTLIHLAGTTTSTRVHDREQWKGFWSQELSEEATVSLDDQVPAGELSHIGVEAATRLSEAVPAGIGTGASVGAVPPLPVPGKSQLEQLRVATSRPSLPEEFRILAEPTEVIRLDLRADRRRIADLLQGDSLPDGARLQLTGSGLRELPPVHIKGRSLQLEFLQAGGDVPLVVRPEAVSGRKPAAMFLIDDGRLDLMNGRLELAGPAETVPSQLVLARNADVVIRQCMLTGAVGASATVPLISFEAGKGGRRHALLQKSMLVAEQSLLGTRGSGLLAIEDCILVSGHSLLELQRSDSTDGLWIDIDHTTLLAGKTHVDLKGVIQPRPTLSVRESVYGTTPGKDAANVCLLTQPGALKEPGIEWWDNRNGYASSLRRFHSGGGSGERPQSFLEDWSDYLGDGHLQRPVNDSNAVLFATVLTSLRSIAPRDFALSPGCSSAHAAEGGGPLGARVDRVGPSLESTRPSAPPQAPQAPGGGANRPLQAPDF